MNLTLADLKYYHPANNHVIVRPVVDTSNIKHGNLELVLGLAANGKPWDEFKSQPIVCEVVSVPHRLIFGRRKVYYESTEELDLTPQQKALLWQMRREAKFTEQTLIDAPIPGSMMWKTPMEVAPDDIVWVNANHLAIADHHGNTLDVEGQIYYILTYDSLYLKKKGDEVRMLNGWVLLEIIEDTPDWAKRAEKMGLTIPEYMKKQEFNDRLGIVRYIGDPVEYVLQDRFDDPSIKEGDTVLLKWKVNRRLEQSNKFFAKDGADFIVSRRDSIMGVLEN